MWYWLDTLCIMLGGYLGTATWKLALVHSLFIQEFREAKVYRLSEGCYGLAWRLVAFMDHTAAQRADQPTHSLTKALS